MCIQMKSVKHEFEDKFFKSDSFTSYSTMQIEFRVLFQTEISLHINFTLCFITIQNLVN